MEDVKKIPFYVLNKLSRIQIGETQFMRLGPPLFAFLCFSLLKYYNCM